MINTLYISSATAGVQNIQFEQRNIGIVCSCIESNWAFIDMQNLYKGTQERGWKINWAHFRQYLQKEYNVFKAVVFMGYLKENVGFYNYLRKAGYEIEFRQIKRLNNGAIDGGNIDADLASYVMDYKSSYTKAIIVADDADYFRTIKSLFHQSKLKLVISSHTLKNTSDVIKKGINRNLICSVHSFRNLIEYKI